MAPNAIEEAVVAKLRELPTNKQQEVLDFASLLESKKKRSRMNSYGPGAGQGESISEEDIAEARGEMWRNFRRDHFLESAPSCRRLV